MVAGAAGAGAGAGGLNGGGLGPPLRTRPTRGGLRVTGSVACPIPARLVPNTCQTRARYLSDACPIPVRRVTNTCQTRDQCLPSPLLSQKFRDTMPIRRVTNTCQTAPAPAVALQAWKPPGEQRAARSPSASCPNGSRVPLSTNDPPTTAVRGRELFPRPRGAAWGAPQPERRLRPPEAVHPRSEAAGGALRAPLMRARAPRCHAGPGPAMSCGPSSRARQRSWNCGGSRGAQRWSTTRM